MCSVRGSFQREAASSKPAELDQQPDGSPHPRPFYYFRFRFSFTTVVRIISRGGTIDRISDHTSSTLTLPKNTVYKYIICGADRGGQSATVLPSTVAKVWRKVISACHLGTPTPTAWHLAMLMAWPWATPPWTPPPAWPWPPPPSAACRGTRGP